MTPEEKTALVKQQVLAKIRWGSSREEVAEWLLEKHGIAGELAEQMLTRAERARHTALRDRAYVRIALACFGLAIVGAFVYVRVVNGIVFYGTLGNIAMVCVIAIGAVSLLGFVRSVAFLLSADAQGGSVD